MALEAASGYFDQREYLWCMLLSAISAVVQDDPISDCIRRSYLLAGVLCHRLDHFHDSWPPASWIGGEDVATSYWKDPISQRAYLEPIQRKNDQLTQLKRRIEAYPDSATPPELRREKEKLEAELREMGYSQVLQG